MSDFFSLSDGDTCFMYSRQLLGGSALSNCVSYAIIIFNMVIREVNIVLIKIIGYHTESQELKTIMFSIFLATFFNTAILLLLTNANTQ